MQNTEARYNVGGVLLPRPFRIRRLGHFGINVLHLGEYVAFYKNLLGFRISDVIDYASRPHLTQILVGVEDTRGYFMYYGSDHHALVFFNQEAVRRMRAAGNRPFDHKITINQISWQCGSLAEIVESYRYFQEREVPIFRTGRDMPGSNWHVSVYDPDGHVVEVYYGIEQVGWDGKSKPLAMHYRRFNELPTLPQPSEEAEIQEAMEKGIDLSSGHRDGEAWPARYEVDGVLLPRPFKITKIGPVKLFVNDLDRSEAFYSEILGFSKTEETYVRGRRCIFLRAGTEHHSIALVPNELKETLLPSARTTFCSFGLEVANYRQLKDAMKFLEEHSVPFIHLPSELSPGLDYSAHVLDPEGHCLQLYYYMEQVGWDGKPRPPELRRSVNEGEWPEVLEALSDTYVDQT